jgi:signal transduction histidine kinase/ligand-binding sensor domain-containing protein
LNICPEWSGGLGRLLRVFAVLTALAAPACPIDPHRAVSQYVRERWSTDQNFPRGSVYDITQTPDGYLWIATETGLIRFDGWNFKPVRDESGSFPFTGLIALLSDKNGALWVQQRNRSILRYENGVFENPFKEPALNITAITLNNDGEFLAAFLEAGAFIVRHRALQPFAAAKGIPRSPVLSIAQTRDGAVWLGTLGAGLFRLWHGQTISVAEGLPNPKINCLLPDADGGLWIGADAGLVHWTPRGVEEPSGASPLRGMQILAIAKDRDGNLWLGSNSHGLIRFNASGVSFLDPGRSDLPAVTSVFEDREGDIWFGSTSGLERLRDSAFVTWSLSEGMPTDGSNPIFVDAENRAWFSPASGGLWWMKDERHGHIAAAGLDRDLVYSISGTTSAGNTSELWLGRQRRGITRLRFQPGAIAASTWTTSNGLAQNSVYSVYVARDGSVWAGTISGGVSRFGGGRFTTFTTADGLASNTVSSFLETADGTLWLATPEGLSAFKNGRWKTWGVSAGLPSANINCLLEDSAGVLWAGTAGGLGFLASGRFHAVRASPAPLADPILGIAEDTLGWLWIATSSRVLRVRRDPLLRGNIADGDWREFGLADGLRGVEGVKRHPSVMRDSEGRIWFSLNRGISVVDPSRLVSSHVAAIAHIESVSVDGVSKSPAAAASVPGGFHRLEFNYSGLSLSFPDRVRFRYMLSGYDSGWSEPVPDRRASYTNLGPGRYTFHVVARNPDGVWGPGEATIAFDVQRLFWQTWWFEGAIVLASAIIVALLYRWRLERSLQQVNLRFEERLAERTRIAQELHDTLLQGFLSASMQLHVAADQIPADSPAKTSIGRVLGLMSRVIEEGRNAVRGLRSDGSAALDLGQAFSHIEQELPGNENTRFRVAVNGTPRPLHPLLRDEVYRIGREAIMNAFRHSGASQIDVDVDYTARGLRVTVRDNGHGIDPRILQSGRDGHWGLTGMRERTERIGGRITLSSSAAAGTQVELSIPSQVAFTGQN